MRRQKPFLLSLAALLYMVTLLIAPTVQAADALQDGTYTIQYNVLQANNDSVSIANDYWEKPATLLISQGAITVQMKINHSAWVTQFKVPRGEEFVDVDVISTDAATDTRVVQFQAADISRPLHAKIHVTVPSINYDHDYTIRFSFDTNSITPVSTTGGAGAASAASGSGEQAGTKPAAVSGSNVTVNNPQTASAVSEANPPQSADQAAAVPNPQTGDDTNVAVYLTLFLLTSAFFLHKLVKRA
ncbi:heme uptake protein IsdC [Brevibacillus sp. TJ4]|uniref:heme uptake protein IsdC n=1 Tax=Brevibacillus sp. TJ4 TaxID=3234853 RepID=UPI003B9EDC63